MRAILALMMLCITATAEAQSPPVIEGGDATDVARILAQTAHAVQLERSTEEVVLDRATGYKRRSDQRVMLIVLDEGTPTDASPRWVLYLAVFNDVNEYGQAWALEPVAWAYRFDGASRRAKGLYAVDIMMIDETASNCGLVPAKVVIDAHDLTVAVREGRGDRDGGFSMGRISAPISVTIEMDDC